MVTSVNLVATPQKPDPDGRPGPIMAKGPYSVTTQVPPPSPAPAYAKRGGGGGLGRSGGR